MDEKHYEVIPGILEKEWESLKKKIKLVESFSKVIHIDFLDGKFAQNVTFLDPAPFRTYTKDVIFEAHLMVKDPIIFIKPLAEVGFTRFIGHVEKMPSQVDFIAEAEKYGNVGLALDIDTPVSAITVPFSDLDFVFCMTVKAGFSRQEFVAETLEKIKEIRIKHNWIPIEVDGGIDAQTLQKAKDAGATRFVTTHFLFDNSNPYEGYQELKNLLPALSQ